MNRAYALSVLSPANPLGLWIHAERSRLNLSTRALTPPGKRQNNVSNWTQPDGIGPSLDRGALQHVVGVIAQASGMRPAEANETLSAASHLRDFGSQDAGAAFPPAGVKWAVITEPAYLRLMTMAVEGIRHMPNRQSGRYRASGRTPSHSPLRAVVRKARASLDRAIADDLIRIEEEAPKEPLARENWLNRFFPEEVRDLVRRNENWLAMRRAVELYENYCRAVREAA